MGRQSSLLESGGENDLARGSTCTYDVSSSEYGSHDPPLKSLCHS